MQQETGKKRKINHHALVLIALHVILLIYSLSGLFSKRAATYSFFSLDFCLFYLFMLIFLGIYAIGWQQILKHLPLTVAFANKAVTVIWGMVWGALFFGEKITPLMIVGAVLVMAGVVLYSLADKKQQDALTIESTSSLSAKTGHPRGRISQNRGKR